MKRIDETRERKAFLKELTFEPVTKSNWQKFVTLFGERGACGNCWCMWPRLPGKEFTAGKVNDGNKNAMKKVVWRGEPVGIIALHNHQPLAWCAFAPREKFLKIENSRVHKRIDDKPVWSIPCFFVSKKFRRKGVSAEMLKAIIQYAKKNKIDIIEAYPTIPTKETLPDAFAWIGLYKTFEKAGFKIVDRTSNSSPTVRYFTREK
jgi:GNAT superfamily N-acetyltransferase